MTDCVTRAPGDTGRACAGRPADLTLLLRAAAHTLLAQLGQAGAELGLRDERDCLVLAALADEIPRSQLQLSRKICMDKTALVMVLDRLEARNLAVRTIDPTNRRIRIPHITPDGHCAHTRLKLAREEAEAQALNGMERTERALLLQLLARVANSG